ncbi:MAG: lactonase family protein [Isosphaeraceae bacterium]
MARSIAFLFVLSCWLVRPEAVFADAPPSESTYRVYVGTYTGGNSASKGIYRFDFDSKTGRATAPEVAAQAISPSFLAIAPSKRFLYAVGEVESSGGKPGGTVSAFAIEPDSGSLRHLNSQSTVGAGPCHLVVDASGRNVLVANYGGGSTAVLPIGDGGKLVAASSFKQHKGSSVNPQRQKEPHAHSVNLDPGNRFAFVADLGLDQVLVYHFDPAQGTITPNTPPFARVAAGAGPRHFAFHPDGKHAYAINELNSTVTAFDYDPASGNLTETQTISTLPADFKGTNYPADIHVHPSGKFVYGSNRGHDSIAVFSLDAQFKLSPVGHQGKGIKNPRNFGIDPSGRFVLVANQDANTVLVFAVDPATGALTPTETVISIPKPVCVQFLPLSAGR